MADLGDNVETNLHRAEAALGDALKVPSPGQPEHERVNQILARVRQKLATLGK
jgi:hypothetical protein